MFDAIKLEDPDSRADDRTACAPDGPGNGLCSHGNWKQQQAKHSTRDDGKISNRAHGRKFV